MNNPRAISTFKTRQQIATEYGLSRSAFWRKLKKHHLELSPGLISLEWQKKIYESLGYPSGVSWKDFADIKLIDNDATS